MPRMIELCPYYTRGKKHQVWVDADSIFSITEDVHNNGRVETWIWGSRFSRIKVVETAEWLLALLTKKEDPC